MQALKQAIQFSSTTPNLRFTETLVHIYGLRIFDIEEYQRTWRLAQIRTAAVYVQRAYRQIFMKKFLSPSAPRRMLADVPRSSAVPGPALADLDDSLFTDSSSKESSRLARGQSDERTLSGDFRSSAQEVGDLSDLGL